MCYVTVQRGVWRTSMNTGKVRLCLILSETKHLILGPLRAMRLPHNSDSMPHCSLTVPTHRRLSLLYSPLPPQLHFLLFQSVNSSSGRSSLTRADRVMFGTQEIETWINSLLYLYVQMNVCMCACKSVFMCAHACAHTHRTSYIHS